MGDSVIYYDIYTGKRYNKIPKGYTIYDKLDDKSKAAVQNDIKRQDEKKNSSKPTTGTVTLNPDTPVNLDYNTVVTPDGVTFGPEDTTPLRSDETAQNLFHRFNVLGEDNRVRRSSNFAAALNFLSPSQYFGAVLDAIQNKKSFKDSMLDGNSGLVSDEFQRNHPYLAFGANFLGDAAIGAGLERGLLGFSSLGRSSLKTSTQDFTKQILTPIQRKFALWNNLVRYNKKLKLRPEAEIYFNNPQLQDIGSVYQYLDYVDNIFPNSKFNQVVYHGGMPGITRFKTPKMNTSSDAFTGNYGIYFTPKKNLAKLYSRWADSKNGTVYPVILNIKKGLRYDHYTPLDYMNGWNKSKFSVDNISDYWYNKLNLDRYDAIILNKTLSGTSRSLIAVFDPDNIHILGNANDVNGFADFVKNPKLSINKFNTKFENLPILWNITPKTVFSDINNNKLVLGLTGIVAGVTGLVGKSGIDNINIMNKLKSIYNNQNRTLEDVDYMKHYYGLDDNTLDFDSRKYLLDKAKEDGFDLSKW